MGSVAAAQDARTDHELSQQLIAAARDMIPVLRKREISANAAGQISAKTITEFKNAGFFKVLQPKRFGGYELPISTYGEISRTLAEGCMSSAWVYGVLAVHNWQLALFELKLQEEVWGKDPSVLLSSSYMPVGKVTKTDGGYMLSGRWGFSSGSAHADWVILGAGVFEDGKNAPDLRTFVLPRADYEIVDNWDVMGLEGTGSNDIVVDNAFVPEHRVLRDLQMFEMNCPGMPHNPAALYRIPFAQVFNRTVSVTSLGTLRRAVDEFKEATRNKLATYTGAQLARDTTIQFAVAEVERTITELELIVRSDCDRLMELAESGGWSIEERARLGASTTSIVSRCIEAIDQLMTFTGSKAIFKGSVIQKAFLDIHVARAHVANNPFPYGRNYGGIMFGLDNSTIDI